MVLMAAVLSGIIFFIGLFIGFWFDNMRAEDVSKTLLVIDNQGNDARLQNLYYQIFYNVSDSFCTSALQENLKFNERIYQTGVTIDRFEEANRFSDTLLQEKTRYALLQAQFWFNAIHIKKACNADYSTMVYLYSNFNRTLANDQRVQSAINLDLKEKCGPKLMLVVLPVDLNITTVDAIVNTYNISRTPALIINENIVLQGLHSKQEVESYFNC